MAAVLLTVKREVSCTDVRCQWSWKKPPEEDVVITIDCVHERKKLFSPNYEAVPQDVSENLRKDLEGSKAGAGVRFTPTKPSTATSRAHYLQCAQRIRSHHGVGT